MKKTTKYVKILLTVICNGGIAKVTDVIKFEGRKSQIITQLNQYMSPEDAERFFVRYFNQSKPARNQKLKVSSINAVGKCKTKTSFPDIKYVGHSRVKPSVVHAHALVGYRKASKRLTFSEIGQTSFSIGNGNIRKHYSKKFTKITFVCAAVALDIALYCTLGFSFVGTAITAVTAVFDSSQKKEKEVALCIATIVEKEGFLPQYSAFRKSNCKNYSIECSYHNEKKCNITKDVFVKVVNQLIRQKVLIIK